VTAVIYIRTILMPIILEDDGHSSLLIRAPIRRSYGVVTEGRVWLHDVNNSFMHTFQKLCSMPKVSDVTDIMQRYDPSH
jgi:hypothetical protein